MLHPSYTDLMKVVNCDVEQGEHPVVNSRYSIVIATAKRAKQLINGEEPKVDAEYPKPLSVAIQELYEGKVKILGEDETTEEFYDENFIADNYEENYSDGEYEVE
ncbi:MAG: DNA-directed RNA polymerase subunit omega [Clostridiales bacterium]|nr:DNA-directed RNA polymerase subunit omega [Clostridiales bacterium]